MLPSIFGESLFDDWFDFPFRGFESDVDRKLYGKHAARVMKTDLKEHDEGYELKVDLPGFKKDQIDLQLQNGYLTITASKGLEEEGKDKKGKIVHQERYSGSMTRTILTRCLAMRTTSLQRNNYYRTKTDKRYESIQIFRNHALLRAACGSLRTEETGCSRPHGSGS